ncbi:hypothetical protein D3C72_2382590 [compost metagenome]
MKWFWAPLLVRISSSSLVWMARVSRICAFCRMNTIRKVISVAPVLASACQVLE